MSCICFVYISTFTTAGLSSFKTLISRRYKNNLSSLLTSHIHLFNAIDIYMNIFLHILSIKINPDCSCPNINFVECVTQEIKSKS